VFGSANNDGANDQIGRGFHEKNGKTIKSLAANFQSSHSPFKATHFISEGA
jgi:hypothetical protein